MQWTRVKDKMPRKGGKYLVWIQDAQCYYLSVFDGYDFIEYDCGLEIEELEGVTHWCKLPREP